MASGTVTTMAASGGRGPAGRGPVASAAFAVERLPSGPVRIRIIDSQVAAQDTEALVTQMNDLDPVITVPPGLLKAGLTLDVGRAARKGEAYAVSGAINALSPRGRFYCLKLRGVTPQVAQAKLTAAGYTVHFSPPVGDKPPSTPPLRIFQDYRPSPPPGLVVSAKWEQPGEEDIVSDKDVFLLVVPADDPHFQADLWQNFPDDVRASAEPDYSSCPT